MLYRAWMVPPVPVGPLTGAARIVDGDGLRLGSEIVRLAGIDAPERDQLCQLDGRDYACGRQAADRLASLIEGRTVHCIPEHRDRYDRLLAVCTAGGVELNQRMVETGWAIGYERYGRQEQVARQSRLGLWRGQFERPRDFRRKHGDAQGWWSWWPW